MKKKLVETFKDAIVINKSDGRDDVVTFRRSDENIIRQLHDIEIPKSRQMQQKVLALAAKILTTDVKDLPEQPNHYPCLDELDTIDKVIIQNQV